MDDIDRQLIGLLRDNARASLASLAKTLRMSRAARCRTASTGSKRTARSWATPCGSSREVEEHIASAR